MKSKAFLIILLFLVSILSGCISPNPPNPPDNSGEFKPSIALVNVSEETQKKDQFYCEYDESRNKVAIIIKENGTFDNPKTINSFNEYFASVKKHLNIDNAGVQKFNGTTIDELDKFIEDMVVNNFAGYIILVGEDLPISLSEEPQPQWACMPYGGTILNSPDIREKFSKVGTPTNDESLGCPDVAITTVIAPQTTEFTNEKKNEFMQEVFENFAKYHNDPQQTFAEFDQKILLIVDLITSAPGNVVTEPYTSAPDQLSDYRTIYFYDTLYALNTEHEKIRQEFEKNPLILMYDVHGLPQALGLGIFDPQTTPVNPIDNVTYVSPQQMIEYSKNTGKTLFINIRSACCQHVLKANPHPQQTVPQEFCCWPQAWLASGAWTVSTVSGPYHHSFERWFFKEKVLGKALRKTNSGQTIVYGDVLATAP